MKNQNLKKKLNYFIFYFIELIIIPKQLKEPPAQKNGRNRNRRI